jgi:hypothetical protein
MTLARSSRCLEMLAILTCLAVAGLAGAQSSEAATKTCSAPKYPDTARGGYFTQLRVTNVSCASGRKLALAYYKCRRKKGVKGSCSGRRVNGMKCTEKRPASGDNGTQFNATVTCRKGSKKVVHSYQQNYGE